jgi:PEP-CTERM motif
MKKFLGSFAAIAVMLFACNSARATLFTVTTTANDGSQSTQTIASSNGTMTPAANGATEWKGSVSQTGSYNMQWDLILDPDPGVSGSIAISNAATTAQTFTLSVSLPISTPPALPPAGSNMFGSSAISVSDADGNGSASLNAPTGGAIYTAFINSPANNQKTLFPVSTSPLPLTVSATPGGVNVASQSFSNGLTTAVASIIGIQHSFVLSAGDSATMNSTFTITAVPEPCTLALAAIGGLGLVAVRRFRRK